MNNVKKCETLLLSMNLILNHIKTVTSKLDVDASDRFVNELMASTRVFLMGAGRSGLVARAFAMRLMHLGLEVYVVGETTTPSVKKGELVVAISGSGETPSIANLGKIAKKLEARLATITSNKDSTLGSNSDIIVVIPGRTKMEVDYEEYLERHMKGGQLAPLGTMFEITSLIYLDAVISEIMVRKGIDESELKKRHNVFE